ncbi:MAG: hypothetical protein V1689_12345 [Pseudomonadota bacterium]
MFAKAKRLSSGALLEAGLISLIICALFLGCATPPKEFNPNIMGPQMIVEPETIRLGVATLKDTPIVFRGKGFQPGDSVFVELLGVKKGDQTVNVPVADANVDKEGYFTAKVETLVKVSELLRAELGSNKEMETIIIITQPPISEGTYTAKATSMEADNSAECQLVVSGPNALDKFKDWLGGVLGKIVKK